MIEFIKKSLLTGLGVAIVAREKLEKAVRNLVDEGKMSQEEAEKLIRELMESGEEHWQKIEGKIKQYVKEGVEGFDICSKKEVGQLRTRVEELEKKLEKVE